MALGYVHIVDHVLITHKQLTFTPMKIKYIVIAPPVRHNLS